jgi:hypothetical protein
MMILTTWPFSSKKVVKSRVSVPARSISNPSHWTKPGSEFDLDYSGDAARGLAEP